MYVAQFNVSKEKVPLDHPSMKDFIDSLDRVNQLADVSEGFVWRLHDESGNATAMRVYEDTTIIFNLSVWASIDTLRQFVYRSLHADVLRRRREWFETMHEANYVLWWVPETHRPSIAEAKERLRHLREHGESPYAFTFKKVHQPEVVHG